MRKQVKPKAAAQKLLNEVDLDYKELQKASRILRAIDHDLRQKIMALIETNGHMNVTDIYKKLRIEQSVASQHLGILREAGLVRREAKGKFKLYTVDKDRLAFISRLIEKMVQPKEA